MNSVDWSGDWNGLWTGLLEYWTGLLEHWTGLRMRKSMGGGGVGGVEVRLPLLEAQAAKLGALVWT